MADNDLGNASGRNYRKFLLGFFGILIGVFIIYVVGFWLVQWYSLWQGQRRVNELAQQMERSARESHERAMQDAYGGKTPQETLQMYIDAVERGDYELASKYFIEEEREGEINKFKKSTQEQIKRYIFSLKTAQSSEGSFSEDKSGYAITRPILIDFKKYPNGIWKIVEI